MMTHLELAGIEETPEIKNLISNACKVYGTDPGEVRYALAMIYNRFRPTVSELREALTKADDMLMDVYIGNAVSDEEYGAAFTRHSALGCSSEPPEDDLPYAD